MYAGALRGRPPKAAQYRATTPGLPSSFLTWAPAISETASDESMVVIVSTARER